MKFITFFGSFFLLLGFLLTRVPISMAMEMENGKFVIDPGLFSAGDSLLLSSSSYQLEEGTFEGLYQQNLTGPKLKLESSVGINGIQSLPKIIAIIPGDYSRFFTDEQATFSVLASTPERETLQYFAKQDGILKKGPQTNGSFSWGLLPADKGRHALSFEVRGSEGTVLMTQNMRAYRRTIK